MTTQEFNEKYKDHLPPRWYGMSIHDEDVIAYLDKEFEKEIAENPNFEFHQIKMKYQYPCVYTNSDKNFEWETGIREILNKKKNEI